MDDAAECFVSLTCPCLLTMHCLGVELGLGFGLANKERSEEDQSTTKLLMAKLDITPSYHTHTFLLVYTKTLYIVGVNKTFPYRNRTTRVVRC